MRLRPGRAGDLEFLRALQEAAMRPHVERVFGRWDPAEQRTRFEAGPDPAAHEIVEVDGEPVGCRLVRRPADAVELVRLYLMPAAQGRGLGTRLVLELVAEADRRGLPVRLRVLRGNPAERLYRRLGFEETGRTGTHVSMEHRPLVGSGAARAGGPVTDIFQASERIERPVDEVWGVLTDWERAPQWMNGVDSLYAEGASVEGTTLVFAARGQERASTIEAWEPPRRLVLTSRQGGMTARYEYRCDPEGDATRATLCATCEARGPVWRLLTPLIRVLIRRSDAGQIAALKRVAESS